MFFASFALTSYFHHYVTPGKGKSTKEVLERIDYGGIVMLLITVAATLLFLSVRYNEGLPWSNPAVVASGVPAFCVPAHVMRSRSTFPFPGYVPRLRSRSRSMFSFHDPYAFQMLDYGFELFVAREPILAPFLLKQKIPVLIGISNILVAISNFATIYFFPIWFQTVLSTSASTAGLHLIPNSVGLTLGSIFAGYMMHRMGRYKTINFIFGLFPFVGASLIANLHKDSSPYLMWLSILPVGFGNAVILQTMFIALLVHLPESQLAVGTGFGQLFRGIGQVSGVAISSAIFQSNLDTELRRRIHGPDADELVMKIRHSSQLLTSLPYDLQKIVRDSYAISLKSVFIFSACSTFLAFLVRIPIPDKDLDQKPKGDSTEDDPMLCGSITRSDPEFAIDESERDEPERDEHDLVV
ncbi:major facilitator superfamily domain-containing protein [Lyophyllum atratum]|nr:major facilitator superfamily domain-containing protein [Lyophyllum atratum]